MNKHVIIIRFHYKENDPRFEWRFAYFQAMVLPRLLKQTNQNFDIAIRCNEFHAERFKKLSDKIITFQVKNEAENHREYNGQKYFYDFTKWENVIGLPKYEIQSGLDSDDLVGYGYIDRIQKEVAKHRGIRLHISFKPKIFNVKTLKTYPIGTMHDEQHGSAFMSLYQPTVRYNFIYELSHLRIGKLADKTLIINDEECFATVHGINESTNKQN